MHLAKKIGVICITLIILFAQVNEIAAVVVSVQPQMVVKEKVPQTVSVNTAAGITDSTGNYEYAILQNGTAQILKHLKTGEKEVKIPSVLDGYTVTSIGKKAFYEEDSVTDVEIPGTVTEIGEQAFESTGITGISIPESVVSIGERAFEYCDSPAFTELVIPDSVIHIGRIAFASCENLKRVVIGKNVREIDYATFMACKKLSEVVIHGKLEVIGEEAFRECYSLSKINIPDSVTEIGNLAFYDCWSLKSIMVPESVTQIGNKAIGYADDCSELISGVSITGYKGTAVYRYAKNVYVAFQDAETGEVIRYDLILVPRERIEFLFAGKKRIELDCKEIEKATYQVAVREAGTSFWEKHYVEGTSATVRGLKAKKQYEVKVRALREIEGEEYYGKWSKVKKVTMGSGVR